jgi:hypothetical protein
LMVQVEDADEYDLYASPADVMEEP